MFVSIHVFQLCYTERLHTLHGQIHFWVNSWHRLTRDLRRRGAWFPEQLACLPRNSGSCTQTSRMSEMRLCHIPWRLLLLWLKVIPAIDILTQHTFGFSPNAHPGYTDSTTCRGDGVAQFIGRAAASRSKGPKVRIPSGAQCKFVSFSETKMLC